MVEDYSAIPFLSSILNPIELKSNIKYVTTNNFDYNYYSKNHPSVTLLKVDFDAVINFQEDLFKTYQEHTVNYKIGNNIYEINLKRIYLTILSSNYKEKLLEQYLSSLGYKYKFDIEKEKTQKTSKYTIKRYQLNKVASSFFELINFRRHLVESHSNVSGGGWSNHLFNNYLFLNFHHRDVEKKVNEVLEKSVILLKIPSSYQLEFKENIRSFLITLHYLHFKKYERICISNFTGVMQYAAIEYAASSKKKVEIYQHGRYMFHHRPAPEKVEYLPSVISLWEDEFIDKLLNKKTVNKISFISRNPLSKKLQKRNFILIATSSPLTIDIDIYYHFWSIIEKISKQSGYNFCIKLHSKDIITLNIIRFFGLSEKIALISNIEFLPKCAITLNSTIYYELLGFVPLLDFKNFHSDVDVENFINSYISE